jgi:hypothetical protein
MEKNPSPPPNLKGIKARHLGPSHWLDEIPLQKTVCHNFSSWLLPLAKNRQLYQREGEDFGQNIWV